MGPVIFLYVVSAQRMIFPPKTAVTCYRRQSWLKAFAFSVPLLDLRRPGTHPVLQLGDVGVLSSDTWIRVRFQ